MSAYVCEKSPFSLTPPISSSSSQEDAPPSSSVSFEDCETCPPPRSSLKCDSPENVLLELLPSHFLKAFAEIEEVEKALIKETEEDLLNTNLSHFKLNEPQRAESFPSLPSITKAQALPILDLLFKKIKHYIPVINFSVEFSIFEFFLYLLEETKCNTNLPEILNIKCTGDGALSLLPGVEQQIFDRVFGNSLGTINVSTPSSYQINSPINYCITIPPSSVDDFEAYTSVFAEFFIKKIGLKTSEQLQKKIKESFTINIPSHFDHKCYATFSFNTHLSQQFFTLAQYMGESDLLKNELHVSLKPIIDELKEIRDKQQNPSEEYLKETLSESIEKNTFSPILLCNDARNFWKAQFGRQRRASRTEVHQKQLEPTTDTLNNWIDHLAISELWQACIDRLTHNLHLNIPIYTNKKYGGWLELIRENLKGIHQINEGIENELLKASVDILNDESISQPEEIEHVLKTYPLKDQWEVIALHFLRKIAGNDFDLSIAMLTQASIALNRSKIPEKNDRIRALWSSMLPHLQQIKLLETKADSTWTHIYEIMAHDNCAFELINSYLEIRAFLSMCRGPTNTPLTTELCAFEKAPAFRVLLGKYYLYLSGDVATAWSTLQQTLPTSKAAASLKNLDTLLNSSEKLASAPISKIGVDFTYDSIVEQIAKFACSPHSGWESLIEQGLLTCALQDETNITWKITHTHLPILKKAADQNFFNKLLSNYVDEKHCKETSSNLLIALALINNLPPYNCEQMILQAYSEWKIYDATSPEVCSESEWDLLKKIVAYRPDLATKMFQSFINRDSFNFEQHEPHIEQYLSCIFRSLRKDPIKYVPTLHSVLDMILDKNYIYTKFVKPNLLEDLLDYTLSLNQNAENICPYLHTLLKLRKTLPENEKSLFDFDKKLIENILAYTKVPTDSSLILEAGKLAINSNLLVLAVQAVLKVDSKELSEPLVNLLDSILEKMHLYPINSNDPHQNIHQAYAFWKTYDNAKTPRTCSDAEWNLVLTIADHNIGLASSMFEILIDKKLLNYKTHKPNIHKYVSSICKSLKEDTANQRSKLCVHLQKALNTFNDTSLNTYFLKKWSSYINPDNILPAESNELLLQALSLVDLTDHDLCSKYASPIFLEHLLNFVLTSKRNVENIYPHLQTLLNLRITQASHDDPRANFDKKLVEAILEHTIPAQHSAFILNAAKLAVNSNHLLLAIQALSIIGKVHHSQSQLLSSKDVINSILEKIHLHTNDQEYLYAIVNQLLKSETLQEALITEAKNTFTTLAPLFSYSTINQQEQLQTARDLFRFLIPLCSKFGTPSDNYYRLLPLVHTCLSSIPSQKNAFYKCLISAQNLLQTEASKNSQKNDRLLSFFHKRSERPVNTPITVSSDASTIAELTKELSNPDPNLKKIIKILQQAPINKKIYAKRLEFFEQIFKSKEPELNIDKILGLILTFKNKISLFIESKENELIAPAVDIWNSLEALFRKRLASGLTAEIPDQNTRQYLLKQVAVMKILINGLKNSDSDFKKSFDKKNVINILDKCDTFKLNFIFRGSILEPLKFLPENRRKDFINAFAPSCIDIIKHNINAGYRIKTPEDLFIEIGKVIDEASFLKFILFAREHVRGLGCALLLAKGFMTSHQALSPLVETSITDLFEEATKEQTFKQVKTETKEANFFFNSLTQSLLSVKNMPPEIIQKAWEKMLWTDIDYFLKDADRVKNFCDVCEACLKKQMESKGKIQIKTIVELLFYLCAYQMPFPSEKYEEVMNFMVKASVNDSSVQISKIQQDLLLNMIGQQVHSPISLYRMLNNSIELSKHISKDTYLDSTVLFEIFYNFASQGFLDSCFDTNEQMYLTYLNALSNFSQHLLEKGAIDFTPFIFSLILGQSFTPNVIAFKSLRAYFQKIQESRKIAQSYNLQEGYLNACRLISALTTAVKNGLFKISDDPLFLEITDFIMMIALDYKDDKELFRKIALKAIEFIAYTLPLSEENQKKRAEIIINWLTCLFNLNSKEALELASLLFSKVRTHELITESHAQALKLDEEYLDRLLLSLATKNLEYELTPQENLLGIEMAFSHFSLKKFPVPTCSSAQEFRTNMEKLDFITAFQSLFQESEDDQIFMSRYVLFKDQISNINFKPILKDSVKQLGYLLIQIFSEFQYSKTYTSYPVVMWNSLRNTLRNFYTGIYAKSQFNLDLFHSMCQQDIKTHSELGIILIILKQLQNMITSPPLEEPNQYYEALFSLCVNSFADSSFDNIHSQASRQQAYATLDKAITYLVLQFLKLETSKKNSASLLTLLYDFTHFQASAEYDTLEEIKKYFELAKIDYNTSKERNIVNGYAYLKRLSKLLIHAHLKKLFVKHEADYFKIVDFLADIVLEYSQTQKDNVSLIQELKAIITTLVKQKTHPNAPPPLQQKLDALGISLP